MSGLGEWKYIWKALFDNSEEKANRVVVELAILSRILDDEERITDYYKQFESSLSCDVLIIKDSKMVELTFREFSIKVVHSKSFTWDFAENQHPKLICYARDDESRKWDRAEVDIVGIAGFCGGLMS